MANIIVIAQGKETKKSLIVPLVVIRKGKKVMEMARVAEKMEGKNSFAL